MPVVMVVMVLTMVMEVTGVITKVTGHWRKNLCNGAHPAPCTLHNVSP